MSILLQYQKIQWIRVRGDPSVLYNNIILRTPLIQYMIGHSKPEKINNERIVVSKEAISSGIPSKIYFNMFRI